MGRIRATARWGPTERWAEKGSVPPRQAQTPLFCSSQIPFHQPQMTRHQPKVSLWDHGARKTQQCRARWLTSSSHHKLNTVCAGEFIPACSGNEKPEFFMFQPDKRLKASQPVQVRKGCVNHRLSGLCVRLATNCQQYTLVTQAGHCPPFRWHKHGTW